MRQEWQRKEDEDEDEEEEGEKEEEEEQKEDWGRGGWVEKRGVCEVGRRVIKKKGEEEGGRKR